MRSREELCLVILEAIEQGGHVRQRPIMTSRHSRTRQLNTINSLSQRAGLGWNATEAIIIELLRLGMLVYTPSQGRDRAPIFHETGEFWMTVKGLQYRSKLRSILSLLSQGKQRQDDNDNDEEEEGRSRRIAQS